MRNQPDGNNLGGNAMTNQEAYKLISERAEELSKNPFVKEKAEKIFKKSGMEEAKRYIFNLAICTLIGIS